jgi:arsenate reductase-like glutaredoxin family protein
MNKNQTVGIYGIKACDTMKKARDWLAAHGVDAAFHDYKVAGVDRAHLEAWSQKVGWEVLLNRAGTTFKNLPHADKQGIDQDKAIALDDQAPCARPWRRAFAGRLQTQPLCSDFRRLRFPRYGPTSTAPEPAT